MEELNAYPDLFLTSLRNTIRSVVEVFPRLLAAAVVLVVGWLLARLLAYLVRRLLLATGFSRLAEHIRLTEVLTRARVRVRPERLLSRAVYYLILLLTIVTAADLLGWTTVSSELSKLIAYVPRLLGALVFFFLGFYLVTFLRDLLRGAASTLGLAAGRVVTAVVYYLLLILISLTALEQAGVDTSILTSNLLLIVGSILLAGTISYGFASRDVLRHILASFFSRRTVRVGQLIEFDGQRGRVVEVTSLAVRLQLNESEQLLVPSGELIRRPIKLIDEG